MSLNSSPVAARLYLIRHGATEANERRPYILQGCGIDLPLSAAGRQQAVALADFCRCLPLTAVYASPLRRAMETALAVAGRHGLAAEPLDGLRECNVGRWEGKDWGSIERDFPDEYRQFMDHPGETPYLGGESYADVFRRVEPVLQDVLDRHPGEAVAVIAHQVVNRAYLGALLGLDPRRYRTIRQANTGINLVECRDGVCELVILNACFHVLDLPVV